MKKKIKIQAVPSAFLVLMLNFTCECRDESSKYLRFILHIHKGILNQ